MGRVKTWGKARPFSAGSPRFHCCVRRDWMVERNYGAMDAASYSANGRDCRLRVGEHEWPCANQAANGVRLSLLTLIFIYYRVLK